MPTYGYIIISSINRRVDEVVLCLRTSTSYFPIYQLYDIMFTCDQQQAVHASAYCAVSIGVVLRIM